MAIFAIPFYFILLRQAAILFTMTNGYILHLFLGAHMKQEQLEIQVSRVISSNMVVQRDVLVPVWGTANISGIKIFGEFMGETVQTTVNSDGTWLFRFSPHAATRQPQEIKIYGTQGASVIFSNILVGDVYFISGQSNAELNLIACIDADPADKLDLQSDIIRIFAQNHDFVVAHPELWAIPQTDVINREWGWQPTGENAYTFSALGYYFGKELSKSIPDIPLGLVMGAAGGAQIVELLPKEIARKQGYTTAAAVGLSGYYNTLVHPFLNMPIRAMLFYQGESESIPQCCGQYGSDLKELVAIYRKNWGISFPFYNMQLSSHGKNSYEYWPSIGEVRAVQYQAVREIPDYYLTVAMDSGFVEGDPDFAHPRYKKVLGQRLAKLMLATEYGLADLEYASSPYVENVKWEQSWADITYRYVGDGLKTAGNSGKVLGFQIEADGQRTDAKAEIIYRNTVRVFFESAVSAICYGMQQLAGTDVANLMNSENLPAPAMRLAK